MEKVSTIGLDIAKSVFQVEGTNEAGEVTVRRQLRRPHLLKFFAKLPPCLVGMEACASAHHWARELTALGHEVRLMPPRRVKAYVKWGAKNDQADAAACNEAVTRPSMQFVPIKSIDQQAVLMLHRARGLLDKQSTQLSNAIRGHLAEFGIVAAKGNSGFASLLAKIGKDSDPQIPPMIRPIVTVLAEQWRSTREQMDKLERQIVDWHKRNSDSQRLATIPQFGPITSSAVVASMGDARRFKSGRAYGASVGLVPRQDSTGGKPHLGPITKAGDHYIRRLLVNAAAGMVRRVRTNPDLMPWFAKLLARKTAKEAIVALANKLARIAWAILAKGGIYRASMTTTVSVEMA
jgi:transposase